MKQHIQDHMQSSSRCTRSFHEQMAPSFVAPSLAARPTSTGPTHGQGRNGSRLTSLVAQTVKRLPTMRETWVQSLGREDLLEKEMATHSSIFAWKIPWTEKPGGLQSMGSQRVGHDFTFTFMHNIQARAIKKFMLH